MDTFTLVTGITGILSFVLQVFDLFPKLGKARSVVGLLLVGVCIGSLIRAVEPAGIKINIEVTRSTVVLAVIGAVVIAFLIAAAMTRDARRREELFGVTGSGTLLFILIFGVSGMASVASAGVERLTVQELRLLVDNASAAKDVELAVRHLRALQTRFQDETARSQIEERIHALEREAAAGTAPLQK